MIKRINCSSKVFSTKDFINDSILFDKYIDSINDNQNDIYSDEENYIICCENSSNSVWIWTKKEINQETINEIQEVLDLYVLSSERTKITCKKELYDIIKDSNNVVYQEDDIDVNCLTCKQLRRPEECDGHIYISTILEIDLLYRFCIDYLRETSHEIFFSLDKSYLEKIIYSNGLYAWKNKYNEIVAMASYFGEKAWVRLGLIYTKPEYRRSGYASNLIYELTNAILKEDLEPVVYINNNDLSISKLFSKIGYESRGIINSFTISKTNLKRVII